MCVSLCRKQGWGLVAQEETGGFYLDSRVHVLGIVMVFRPRLFERPPSVLQTRPDQKEKSLLPGA